MLKLSPLLDKNRESETMSDRQPPQSPLTANSSTPVSPAPSLFSARGHARLSSSVSSLVSSPGLRTSMESSKNHLSGVKEEPCGFEARDLEHEYFQHFDQGLAEDSYFSSVEYDGYDLTDVGMDIPPSPKKRRSDSVSRSVSMKGLSRISSQISIISSRFKKRGDDEFPDDLRSRANSTTSAVASPIMQPISRIESSVPPSPARTIFEERLGESGAQPIDIAKANSQSLEDSAPKATTPLLPPFMGDEPLSVVASRVHSPLQSPSVADVSDPGQDCDARLVAIPSPPLSTKPSVTSINRPRASTVRTVSGDAPPFLLTDPNDEWANKLGHANFNIHPEPYVPEVCDLESFRQLRADWDLAQCNFAKHLVRTGEHYGITSTIYNLTEQKWELINRKWKHHHEAMLAELEINQGPLLSLTPSIDPCEQVKIPPLHDNKFPELGDGEIVGPMKIAPATGLCRGRSLKRNFFKFFSDLVTKA